jgi:hypothetical protein
MLHTHISKHFITVKVNLDNYDGLTNPRERIKNVRNILESVTRKNDAICKIFPSTFCGYLKAWYYSFALGSILGPYNLFVEIISYFNTNILTKKNTIKLFTITQ